MSPQRSIAIAADHAGFALKEAIISLLKTKGYDIKDYGTNNIDPVDYPEFAQKVAAAISKGQYERGILICGSGIGMAMAANRFPKVRAAVCHTSEEAKVTRQHNNANVLVLGSRALDPHSMPSIVEAFLTTAFVGGRHEGRVQKIDQLT